MRYLIKLCYDGTKFWGWQKQANGRTVQSVLESAVEQFAGVPTSVIAAGRTDAGVHATAQYAHFDYCGNMLPRQILLAFRRWLPSDVKVLNITPVDQNLSARYQACERSYKYILAKELTPFNRLYTGFIPHLKLSLQPMLDASKLFIGQRDFSSFGRLNPEVPNHICHVQTLDSRG